MGDIKLPYLNKVILTGILAKEPEFEKLENKIPKTTFLLAVGRRVRNYLGEWHEETHYIRVITFQKLAELCNQHLLKGSPVLIEGELQSHILELEEGESHLDIEVNAFKVQFLGKIRKKTETPKTSKSEIDFDEYEIYDY